MMETRGYTGNCTTSVRASGGSGWWRCQRWLRSAIPHTPVTSPTTTTTTAAVAVAVTVAVAIASHSRRRRARARVLSFAIIICPREHPVELDIPDPLALREPREARRVLPLARPVGVSHSQPASQRPATAICHASYNISARCNSVWDDGVLIFGREKPRLLPEVAPVLRQQPPGESVASFQASFATSRVVSKHAFLFLKRNEATCAFCELLETV